MTLPTNPCQFSFICDPVDGTATTIPAVDGEFTLSSGVAPSVANMVIGKIFFSDIPSKDGTLVLSDGVNGTLQFPGCRIMDIEREWEAGKFLLRMTVADRRWKWAGAGWVSSLGHNIRDLQGTIINIGANRASAKDLAVVFLGYLNEVEGTGYHDDNIGLPDGDTSADCPYLNLDRVAPAQILAELCNQYGAKICLKTDNTIAIYRDTVSGALPAGADSEMRNENHQTGDPVPGTIEVWGGKERYEVVIPLFPCVLHVDTTGDNDVIRRVDLTECSWLPQGETAVLPNPVGYGANLYNKKFYTEAELAEQTYFKWYRTSGSLINPDSGGVEGTLYRPIWFSNLKMETNQTQESDGALKYARAYISGTFATIGELNDQDSSQLTGTGRVDIPFSFSPHSGIVVFQKPVWGLSKGTSGTICSPSLQLRCVYEGNPSIYMGTSGLNGTTTIGTTYDGTLIPYAATDFYEDFQYIYGAGTIVDGEWAYGTCINQEQMDKLAIGYADVLVNEYADKISANGTLKTIGYPGILGFHPNGAIRQVSWSVGINQAPQTVVSWNREHSPLANERIQFHEIQAGNIQLDRIKRLDVEYKDTFKKQGIDSEA